MKRDLEAILKKFRPGKREELIPLLQEVQEEYGFLSEESIVRVGRFTGLSTTKIYGLATFYDQFRFIPAGRIKIRICNGTSCFLNGSQALVNKMKEETGLDPGQTDREGILSYEIATCMGGCYNGPVIYINDEFHTAVKPDQLPGLIRKLRYIIEND
jgi:NADH:ubiquinone oxidoreductase subunit E